MSTDFRSLCAEMLTAWQVGDDIAGPMNRARTLLARPEPQPLPANYIDPEHTGRNQELLEIFYTACQSEGGTADEIHLRGIRAVLVASPTPQPVPVNEGLPGPEDCDDEGYCWWWRTDEVDEWWEFLYLRDARDHNRRCGLARYTHWLPCHAIPNLPNPND